MTIKIKGPIFSNKGKTPMWLNFIIFTFTFVCMINNLFSNITIDQSHNFIHFNLIYKELL